MADYSGQYYTLTSQDTGVTIAADDTFVIGRVEGAGRVTAVTYTPEAASTGDNTNKRVYTVINKGAAGSGSTVIATLDLVTGVNLVAFDEKAFTLSATAADLVVAQGDILALLSDAAASGLVDPGGVVKVTIEREAD
jgi:hypothetical protein